MSIIAEYNTFADIYDLWIEGEPNWVTTHDFYVEICQETPGLIVELGVGTGRIAIDIAKTGKQIIGVDLSAEMLKYCQEKADVAGVGERLSLVLANACEVDLDEKANLITLPFCTLGHFLTISEKQLLFNNVYKQLVPGGYFIFDHYVLDKNKARNKNKLTRLMYPTIDSDQTNLFIWDTYLYDFSNQIMKCFVTVEKSSPTGLINERRHHRFDFSWIEPEQTRTLLLASGFEIEKLYGGCDRQPFNSNSAEQVWIVRRPR